MFTTITVLLHCNMASCRKLNKLSINMNTIPSSGRLSRNSQGICNMFQHPMEYTAPQSDQQHTPVNTPLSRNVLTSNTLNRTPPWQIHRFVNPSDVDVSDFVDISPDTVHDERCNNTSQHENLFQDNVRK